MAGSLLLLYWNQKIISGNYYLLIETNLQSEINNFFRHIIRKIIPGTTIIFQLNYLDYLINTSFFSKMAQVIVAENGYINFATLDSFIKILGLQSENNPTPTWIFVIKNI